MDDKQPIRSNSHDQAQSYKQIIETVCSAYQEWVKHFPTLNAQLSKHSRGSDILKLLLWNRFLDFRFFLEHQGSPLPAPLSVNRDEKYGANTIVGDRVTAKYYPNKPDDFWEAYVVKVHPPNGSRKYFEYDLLFSTDLCGFTNVPEWCVYKNQTTVKYHADGFFKIIDLTNEGNPSIPFMSSCLPSILALRRLHESVGALKELIAHMGTNLKQLDHVWLQVATVGMVRYKIQKHESWLRNTVANLIPDPLSPIDDRLSTLCETTWEHKMSWDREGTRWPDGIAACPSVHDFFPECDDVLFLKALALATGKQTAIMYY